MDVKILGSGHAYEVPNSDCKCEICSAQRESEDPRDVRKRSSIALKDGGESFLLIDVGPDYPQQKRLLREFIGTPEGESLANGMNILLTHSHPDHALGLPQLESAVRGGKPIPLFAHERCFDRLEEMDFGYLFRFGTLEKNIVIPGEEYEIGGFNVRPFKVYHNETVAPGSVGYVIDSEGRRFVYTGDFGKIENPEEVTKDGRRINVLVAECNWFNDLEGRKDHMSFQRLISYLIMWNPERFILTHLGSDDELTGKDSPVDFPYKRRPTNPLGYETPRTHGEWDERVREVLKDYDTLRRYASQKFSLIAHDGLEFRV